jgi:hypothetical protein
MYDDSLHSTKIARTDVAIARRCGLLVESCGKVLQEYDDELTKEDGLTIERYGKYINRKVDKLLMYVQLLQIKHLHSKDLARQAVQLQIEIRKAYSQALEIYVNSINKRIDKFHQRL